MHSIISEFLKDVYPSPKDNVIKIYIPRKSWGLIDKDINFWTKKVLLGDSSNWSSFSMIYTLFVELELYFKTDIVTGPEGLIWNFMWFLITWNKLTFPISMQMSFPAGLYMIHRVGSVLYIICCNIPVSLIYTDGFQ